MTMKEEEKLSKGRQQGSKNKKVLSLRELIRQGLTKGIMMSGFTISNNKLRMTIATEISPLAALLYTQILSHRNRKTNKCFPSISVLSKETGISERKISDLIGDLCEGGFLIVRSGGRHYANTYWFPCEPWFDPNDVEVLMAYRRKNIFSKKSISTKEAQEDIKKSQEEFAYGKSIGESFRKLEKELEEKGEDIEELMFG